MDRLDAMTMFVVAVDQGSLAAAARKLGCSPPTVTRAIKLLEDRLRERLLHRVGGRLRLTESGERQLAVYRSVLAQLKEADGSHGGDNRFDGTLTITAPELFGRQKVMPVVEGFLAEHPLVRARVLLLNRVVNFVEEGVDVAVRLAPLPDSAAVAIRLGEVRRLVCVAPSYIARFGLPSCPMDLQQHACIGQEDGTERELWRFVERPSARRRTLPVAIQPRIATNSAGAAIDAALRGSGICRAMSYQVVDHIATRRLVAVLHTFEPEPIPVHLVFLPIPRGNAILRAFIGHSTPQLRKELAWISTQMGQ